MAYLQNGYLCINNDQGQVKPGGGAHYPVHRLVYEQEHGEIPDGWIIHHVNGDKLDNRLANLEALPRSEHPHRHRTKTQDGAAFCSECESWKPLSDFYRARARDTGRQSLCKICAASRHRAWCAANPERLEEYKRRARERYRARMVT